MAYTFDSFWDVLVVTFKTQHLAAAAQNLFELKKQHEQLPKDLDILCIEDPQEEIGSGGATLNALLTATEHFSVQQGFSIVTSDVLKNARVFIMHSGRFFPFDCSSRTFVCLPLVPEDGECKSLITNFDALFYVVTKHLAMGSPPGLWVCSSDMLLNFPQTFKLNWSDIDVGNGIIGISVPATVQYASNHGIYVVDDNFVVKDLLFQEPSSSLTNYHSGDGTVPLVAGVVFFSVYATEHLLATHVIPPLDGCTYMGIDSGVEPVRISLYFDILLATASDVNEEDYVTGKRSGIYGKSPAALKDPQKQFMVKARSVLWKHVSNLQLKVVLIKEGKHCYLDMQQSAVKYCKTIQAFCPLISGYKYTHQVHSFVHEKATVGQSSHLINSIIECGSSVGDETTIVHSHISSNVQIGNHCYIYGLDENSCKYVPNNKIPNNSFVIGMSVEFKKGLVKRLYACLPSEMRLMVDGPILLNELHSSECIDSEQLLELINFSTNNSKVLPYAYQNILRNQNISEDCKTILMAKIFPTTHLIFDVNISHAMFLINSDVASRECDCWFDFLRCSFCEMLENVNSLSEFKYQLSLYLSVAEKRITHILTNNLNISLLPLFKTYVLSKDFEKLLNILDKLAIDAVKNVSDSKQKPGRSSRIFACISDVLGLMAGKKGRLRSGPAANKQWKEALTLLANGNLEKGVAKMAKIREKWLHNSDLLVRAARHYEGAEQILIKHAVMSASAFVHPVEYTSIKEKFWCVAECPSRIDISGGWTDTPPICYEYGGSVVNAAVLLNGKRPIGARIRKLSTCIIRLRTLGANKMDSHAVDFTTTEQFRDYNVPQALGALAKACFIFAGIVDISSPKPLNEQLEERFQGGFELQTWANLPRGSGLGTSSILASVVLRVVYEASGYIIDQESLIHAVLLVEQMLTTGGGWQDQVGGIIGGFKVCRCACKLPLQVTINFLVTSTEFYKTFSNHLKLIYTGKTRLARNLLQNVIRNWYTKQSDILSACVELKKNAEKCCLSFKAEDLSAIGQHMNSYWEQKKSVANGCEPELCKRMMEKLQPYSLGMTLAGAGGGGFMYVLTKEPLSNEFIVDLLSKVEGAQDSEVYDVTVDRIGMVCYNIPVTEE